MTSSYGPFDTIESAHEFLTLLGQQIEEAADEVRRELAACADGNAQRRTDAWRLISYTVTKLSSHITSSRRLLNDLRTLRNLLHKNAAAEQSAAGPAPDSSVACNRATI
jgi:hypothetical protein